ncbi:MAG: ATP-binding protein [Candidatus Firestonebacteria bacterium]
MAIFKGNLYTPEYVINFVNYFCCFGWISFSSFFLWLSVVFVDNKKILKSKLFYIVIFAVPALLIYQQALNQSLVYYVRDVFGWQTVWRKSIWTFLWLFSYSSFFSAGLILLYIFQKKTEQPYKKIQARIIFTTSLFCIVTGSITDAVLPIMGVFVPAIAPIISIIWVIGAGFAIIKFSFLTINPVTASSNILSTMNDCLILLSPEYNIVSVNNSLLKLLEYESEQLLGKSVKMLFIGQEGDSDIFKRAIEGEIITNYELTLVSKNKTNIPVAFSVSILRDDFKNLAGIICIARDITKQKEAEKEKEKMISHLTQSEKMVAVGQLAGGVAHEINNPMTVILGYTQVVLRELKPEDKILKPMLAIEREAKRCKILIESLLTFSRTSKMMKQLAGVNKAIKDSLALIEVQTKIKNIDIVADYGEGLPDIMVNVNQIQQVIINLCNNAMDAMTEGGMIKINTMLDDEFIKITISDTGRGISEEDKKRLFEPFFTTKEVGKGTGLGLSICYEIVKRHNGKISVESSGRGKGTIFTIRLPIGRGLTAGSCP